MMNDVQRIEFADGLAGWACGEGETAVWLHGYTMDSTLWGDLWNLMPRFRHIGIDLPGHGISRRMRPSEPLDAVAQLVLDACHSVRARRLIGLSLGSLVALQTAMMSRGKIERLVLAAPATGEMMVDASSSQKNMVLLRTYRSACPRSALVDLWLRSPPDIFKAAERLPSLYRAIRGVIDKHTWQELETGGMRGWADFVQFETHIRGITARTLILVGDEDMLSFRRNAHVLSRLIPGAKRECLAGLGHLTLLEAPAACAPLLNAHLE